MAYVRERLAPGKAQPAFEAGVVADLPNSWAGRIKKTAKKFRYLRDKNRFMIEQRKIADRALQEDCCLSLDATDEDVCTQAEKCADHCFTLTKWFTSHDDLMSMLRGYLERWGVSEPDCQHDDGFIGRLCDVAWWRRRLRTIHRRAVELPAIHYGMVSKIDQIYISDDGLKRYVAQTKRNQAILESTLAFNEDGEGYTLAELAAKSIANKSIRRGELMLRIRGLEEIAHDDGYEALFVVMTAPSRFHAVRGDGTHNPKYGGYSPRDTQAWHQKNWSRMRAQIKRLELLVFGVRTVEPHADATSHWNLLIFVKPADMGTIIDMITHHWFMRDCPAEKGSHKRLKFERIDGEKGSATSYIAKYISKHLDGMGIENDMFGNPIVTSTMRVEAWARTWGIRQFQTFGEPPVGLWRELRRIDGKELAEAPEALQVAWMAAHRHNDESGAVLARADYAEYLRVVDKLKLAKELQEGLNKYGEIKPERPCGVHAVGFGWRYFGGIVGRGTGWLEAPFKVLVRSVRRCWEIVRAVGLRPSRTRFNNCTFRDVKNDPVHDDFSHYETREPLYWVMDQYGKCQIDEIPG